MSHHSSSSSSSSASASASAADEATTPTRSITQETFTSEPTVPATPTSTETPSSSSSSSSCSEKTQSAIQSLSPILTTIPPSLLSSQDHQDLAFTLLHNPDISTQITSLLGLPNSGSGDNNLCRWFYDTFQSCEPKLQLVVLRFLPNIAGLYLSRVTLKKPLAGFEAVLLALYAFETTSRSGQAITVKVPDLSHPSVYHEPKESEKNNDSTELNLAVISPSLEPHGTVRSTRRARIVGVALELYYSKIYLMPVGSKIEFCEFCEIWSGEDGDEYKASKSEDDDDQEKVNKEKGNKQGRIVLPWELLQPVLRILGHCLLGPKKDKELFGAAQKACRSLHARSLHDLNSQAILATRSLLKLSEMSMDPKLNVDHTEIQMTDVISL